MPTPAGQVAGVRYAMHAQPGRVVAGDLFGFTEISEGRTAFFLGDVAGKGAAAGMLMAVIQASLDNVFDIERMVHECAVVINVAGPFMLTGGEALVEQRA